MMTQLFIIECLAMLVDVSFSLMVIRETPHCGSYLSAIMIAHFIHPLGMVTHKLSTKTIFVTRILRKNFITKFSTEFIN